MRMSETMIIKGGFRAFSKSNVANAPDSEGVYALFDHETLIYIGRSYGRDNTIRAQLQHHKDGLGEKGTRRATLYWRELCDNPIAREQELMDEYQASNGEPPPCNVFIS